MIEINNKLILIISHIILIYCKTNISILHSTFKMIKSAQMFYFINIIYILYFIIFMYIYLYYMSRINTKYNV